MTTKPMKSTNDNPTPTTLREILSIFSSLVGSEYADMKNDPVILLKHRDQATQSIQEQLKALLPKKHNLRHGLLAQSEEANDDWHERKGFNQAIDQIEKAIEEWAK